MTTTKWLLMFVFVAISACSERQEEAGDPAGATAATPAGKAAATSPMDIVPGLDMRILQEGDGGTAQPGQSAVVHYTGWLYDPEAPGNRGQKFDSSRDRGEPFEFRLGAGQVIKGWDQGVTGMKTGEVRELTIAPDLAYGERGAGDIIPPGSTLVFEVELLDVKGQPAVADE